MEQTPPQALLDNPDSVHITLVRHGETFQNRDHVVQGQDPTWGRLTPEGVRQAQLLGGMLADRSFDVAYCSPLERAVLTMSLLLVPRPGNRTVPLVFADDLREINQGAMHGNSHLAWKAAIDGHNPMEFRPAGGENWLEVQQRVIRYLSETVLTAPQRKVLIVAHGGVNRGLLAHLTGMSMGDAWRGAGVGCPQDNTCVNELVVDRQGRLLWARVNDSRHLQGEFEQASGGQLWRAGAQSDDERWQMLEPFASNGRSAEFNPYG